MDLYSFMFGFYAGAFTMVLLHGALARASGCIGFDTEVIKNESRPGDVSDDEGDESEDSEGGRTSDNSGSEGDSDSDVERSDDEKNEDENEDSEGSGESTETESDQANEESEDRSEGYDNVNIPDGSIFAPQLPPLPPLPDSPQRRSPVDKSDRTVYPDWIAEKFTQIIDCMSQPDPVEHLMKTVVNPELQKHNEELSEISSSMKEKWDNIRKCFSDIPKTSMGYSGPDSEKKEQ